MLRVIGSKRGEKLTWKEIRDLALSAERVPVLIALITDLEHHMEEKLQLKSLLSGAGIDCTGRNVAVAASGNTIEEAVGSIQALTDDIGILILSRHAPKHAETTRFILAKWGRQAMPPANSIQIFDLRTSEDHLRGRSNNDDTSRGSGHIKKPRDTE